MTATFSRRQASPGAASGGTYEQTPVLVHARSRSGLHRHGDLTPDLARLAAASRARSGTARQT